VSEQADSRLHAPAWRREDLRPSPARVVPMTIPDVIPAPTISVVIPTLNEAVQLPGAIAGLREADLAGEIVVADGGSSDGTREWLASQPAVRVVEAERGRGMQQNAGAAASRGDVLLFLHADCRLPPDAGAKIALVMRRTEIAGGAFPIRFAETGARALRMVEWGINLRTVWFRSVTGDQAIFVRREAFEALGGFREWPLFEDIDLVRRLKRKGRFVILSSPVTISARRYLSYGIVRTILLCYALRVGYWLGISPRRLKRWFRDLEPASCSSPNTHLRESRSSRGRATGGGR
jgi:rSAM/selenodomain-associated transferase 2